MNGDAEGLAPGPIALSRHATAGGRTRPRRPFRRRLAVRVAAVARWLHIYLSLFGLASVLFFSATGITLNHPDWFYEGTPRQTQEEGRIDVRWLRGGADDVGAGVSRLEVVELLRARHAVRGAMVDFRVDDLECSVSFKGPGYAADAFIDRETGSYTITESRHGLVAVLNDLHKGRDTGPVWSVVIDVSAVALALISFTGLALLAYLKLRRVPGSILGVVGGVVFALIAYFLVP